MSELITTANALNDFLAEAMEADRYALDTEFHREKTFYPKVALVQMAVGTRVVLIDPLVVDLIALVPLLDGPGMCVVHAAAQDLEVLHRSCHTLPSKIFDTQIAASFLGMASTSLASLLAKYEGIQLAKGDRLTDWLRRPLSDDQLKYAAGDVEYLLKTAAQLSEELESRGRTEWVEDECQRMLETAIVQRTPEQSLRRIKEARSLKGKALGIALELVRWRDERAATIDVPVRNVLSDIALVGIAQRAPKTEKALKEIRGVDGRHTSSTVTPMILAAVVAGTNAEPPPPLRKRTDELDRSLRPVVSLVTAWVSQVARNVELDPAVLATRTDVESFLTDGVVSRLDSGWRGDIIGAPISALVTGKAALAFDGNGGLALERRSGEPLT